ncbi:MAG: zinc ribbon domain-containing protein [Clostridia bacterium]|nr:zinc ribbon domain-containing protein [Clostridia bacterium]
MGNNFCGNCGAALKQGVKFCGKCGHAVPGVPVTGPNPAAPAGKSMSYRLMIPASYKKNLISIKGCTLIFSDSQILIAFFNQKLMNQHINEVRNEARDEGFFKRAAAVMSAGFSYSERYRTMLPDAILAESPDNFSILNNSVELVKFKHSRTSYNSDETTHTYPPELTIKCPGGKYNFSLNLSSDSGNLVRVLHELFPERYKGPKR